MRSAGRIAGWLLAAVIAAAPSLADAAQACVSCCCPPAPCHDAGADCEASFAALPCGGATSAAVPSVAKRASEPPAFLAALPAASRPLAGPAAALGHARSGDPEARASALRLSVVRRL
jgi:hypothetical protein